MKKRAPTKADLSAEYVRTLFDYDPSTGLLRHRKRHGVVAGATAGTIDKAGYVRVKINQRVFLAHRIIWLLVTGAWPEGEIDHANGTRSENRWANLRQATKSQNRANTTGPIRGTLKGAYRYEGDRKWRSQIRANGRNRHLGYFESEVEAHSAYVAAAREAFGEFANAGAV